MKTNKTQFPQKDTIIRINLDNGKFATISNKALLDTNLSSDAFRLLTIILNNSKDWSLVMSQAAKLLGWSDERKITRAIKCLVDNGYLIQHQFINSSKGRLYPYTISEFGDLKTKSEETKVEPIIETIDLTPSQQEVEEEPIEEITQPEASNDDLLAILTPYKWTLSKATYGTLADRIKTNSIDEAELKEEINFYID